MTASPPLEFSKATPDDADALARQVKLAFNVPRDNALRYLERIGYDGIRVMREPGGRVAATSTFYELGQHVGGSPVPMAGIAAVAVPPERRGGGVARTMMAHLVRELRGAGFPISTLYAATVALYRLVGYERAGLRYRTEISAKPSRAIEPARGGSLRAGGADDRAGVERVYADLARRMPGWLARNAVLWDRALSDHDFNPLELTLAVGDDGEPEGYAAFSMSGPTPTDPDYHVRVSDIACVTRDAALRLVSMLCSYRSVSASVITDCPPTHPLMGALADRWYDCRAVDAWMLRVLDVPAALSARGYPSAVSAELTLDIADDLLPDNAGRWTLTVEGGRGAAEPARSGNNDAALTLDVRALASLYTGFESASQLALTGRAAGDGRTLAIADAIFAGPAPTMSDMF